jgi:hypothetical protein
MQKHNIRQSANPVFLDANATDRLSKGIKNIYMLF